MKKVALISALVFAMSSMAIAQEKNFSHMEIGALVTAPVSKGDQVSVLPSFMLKQAVVANFFTLQSLETQFGTGVKDSTAFKLGFGYELPSFSFFNVNGEPVGLTLDLLFAKDLVNGFENNAVVGGGLKFDRASTSNFALIVRGFWNQVRATDQDEWETIWSGSIAAEIGIL
jgi:hypothetical protein